MISPSNLSLFAFIAIILLVILQTVYEVRKFNRDAMHWWNSLSHYGKAILISKTFNIEYRYDEPIEKSKIYFLYKVHLSRKVRLK